MNVGLLGGTVHDGGQLDCALYELELRYFILDYCINVYYSRQDKKSIVRDVSETRRRKRETRASSLQCVLHTIG